MSWAVLPEFCFRSQIQNWEELLIDQVVVVPFRGIFRGWRNVLVRNLLKLGKRMCRVVPLGRSSLRHQDRLGNDSLGNDSLQSILAEKTLGFLLDPKLTMSLQCAIVAKVVTSLLGSVRQSVANRLREVMTPLCSALVKQMGGCVQLQVTKYRRDIGHTGT